MVWKGLKIVVGVERFFPIMGLFLGITLFTIKVNLSISLRSEVLIILMVSFQYFTNSVSFLYKMLLN